MDELTSKLIAAADVALKESASNNGDDGDDSSSEVTETASASPDEPSSTGSSDDDDSVEAEAGAEASDEDAPAPADLVDEILAVRSSAERKVRKAEHRVAALEAQLEKAGQAIEQSKQQMVNELFKKLRRAPAKTFQEYGFSFQDLIDAGIREGNGEDSRFADGFDELKQEIQFLKKEREESLRQQETQTQRAQMQQARTEFLSQVDKSKFPTLYSMFYDDRDALWREAISVAQTHERQHGVPPEDSKVIKYLEEKYKARVARLGGGTAEPTTAKKPVAKSLSTKASSETRTSGKPFGQLSAEEQREVLLAAAKKARQPSASN
jgi:hypothetical protein